MAAARPRPKLNHFPALSPLTGEDRAVLGLVEQHPAQARVFAEWQQRNSVEIDIEPIQIRPLQTDGAP